MASLTPAALVANLEAGMRSGSVPPVGEQAGIEEWLPPMAAGIALHAAPDLVCVMVGAPGVENRYHGIDGTLRRVGGLGRELRDAGPDHRGRSPRSPSAPWSASASAP